MPKPRMFRRNALIASLTGGVKRCSRRHWRPVTTRSPPARSRRTDSG
ncbi:hypothetical protein [Streptomyces sp. NPDC056361]